MPRIRKTAADFPANVIQVTVADLNLNHLGYYQFGLPPALYDGYPQVVSFNAFFSSPRHHWGSLSRTRRYFGDHLAILPQSDFRRANPNNLPVVKLANIWAFYGAIGWDHKTKKYIRTDAHFG